MNKDEFVQFWMVFYDKFFKIDTNKDQFISVMEVINYFCAHDMEHFKKAGEYVKGPGSKRRILLFSFKF